jgi:putative hydrolase of the HAD superfamily
MSIRAVTFDFWGTLYREVAENGDLRMRKRAQVLADALGADPADTERALQDAALEFNRVHLAEQRTLTPHDAVRLATAALGATLPGAMADEMARFFAAIILEHPPEPVKDALEAVRAAAACVPVGIISDTGISPGSSLRVLLERDGFLPHLKCLTFSDEVGVAKPQAVMFTRTAGALGVAPGEMLHLGDLEPTDIAGIRALGGRAGLFAGVNSNFLEVTRAEYVFRTWREFIESCATDSREGLCDKALARFARPERASERGGDTA